MVNWELQYAVNDCFMLQKTKGIKGKASARNSPDTGIQKMLVNRWGR